MTVTTTTNRVTYVGDGSTLSFPYTFRVFASSDLKVYLGGVLQTSGYAVTGANEATGGEVQFTLATPPIGTEILIVRDVPAIQPTDYVDGDAFPAQAHEDALDRLTMIAQQQSSGTDRSLRVPLSEASIPDLPAAAARRARLLAFDASGAPYAYDPAILPDRITISADPPSGGVDGDIWFQLA